MADDIAHEVIKTVFSSAILAVLGFLWVVFSKRGQAFWKSLGTVDVTPQQLESPPYIRSIKGGRTFFVLALVGLLLAIGSLIADATMQKPATINVDRIPIEEDGRSTFHLTNGDHDLKVSASNQICTLSFMSTAADAGSCELKVKKDNWVIEATRVVTCGVTCFKFSISK